MSLRLTISLAIPGLPFDGRTLEERSLGGSETAAIHVARHLARAGHRVIVFSRGRPGVYDGVTYAPLDEWTTFATMVPHDLAIVQRVPDLLQARLASRVTWWWCHDLALGRMAQAARGIAWNVDRVLVLSDFMRRQYQEVYGFPDTLLSVTRNGVDLQTVERARPNVSARDRYQLVFAARPERGLDVLLGTIMPRILEKEPRARLWVCGYDNPVPTLQPFYDRCRELAARLGDAVQWMGALKQQDLYLLYWGASVYVYPTPSPVAPEFAEVSCISAMEAQACGLPIVTTARGALPETIAPEAGTLIPDPGPEWSPEAVDAFVEAVLRYVRDDIAWFKASRAGRKRAELLDWSGVAEQWLRWYEEDIARHNDDPVRLAWHFIRQSDIIAARELASRHKDEPRMKPVQDLLDSHWGFVGPGAYREQYEAIGQTHQPPPLEATESETRFRAVRDILAREQPAKLLDVGCAYGAYTILLSNALPNTSIVGIDIDRNSIELARRIAAEKAARPDRIEFRVGTDTADLSDVAPFDAVFAGEVIEHVPEPWAFLERIERWVKPGGLVVLTTPYGPWEYHTPGYAGRRDDNPYPYRAHIWQYDLHDLRDMLGRKPEINLEALPAGRSPLMGDPLGIYIITYRADHKPIGKIDLERKLRHQRPRQTVSASLLVGPGSEHTLRWCLESIKHLADEIVAGDTGCSEEARRILSEYGARVVPAPKPTEAGFAAARNATLDACTMDWVLWIDTDERLVDAANVHKYLRKNHLNGYALHQHHFAVDTTFKPDVPVRLFRRGTCKFYGAIHEHPEIAPNSGPGHVAIVGDAHIAHVGYLAESVRIARFERNWPLLHRDLQEYPGRPLQDHLVCRDYVLAATHELRRTGRLTEEAKAKLEHVIQRWREKLRGKPTYINADTLEYYSLAVRMLGRGVNLKLALEVERDGVQTVKQIDAAFETLEDIEQEVLWRLREAVSPYLARWW